ncbi:Asp23/Gls24 family envelope stress response protein [Nonomuraea typhae]|uniref:Asp23/Gls24 family envelope stress response protein n=1 Tax=Nonomuraea typhae TaxID=2603600 RepID=A0ABW7ZBF7_9ACTN
MSEVLAEQPDPTPAAAVVKGRITVADEVVEKVAALAALEVPGVADMGGDLARAFEAVRDRIGIGSRRGTQGVSAEIQDRQVAIDVTFVVEYGHVVMEVAAEVKANVARSVSRMLGMRVTEVNVTVDDVRLPGEPRPAPPEDEPSAEDPL